MTDLDLQSAATLLHCHPETIRQKAEAGELPAAKVGRSWVFIKDDLLEYLAARNEVVRHQNRLKQSCSDGSLGESDIIEMSVTAPLLCGIYFLLYRGRVVYVGQSTNILTRLGKHARDKQFDAFSYIQFPQDQLTKQEKRYIKKFYPCLNDMHK